MQPYSSQQSEFLRVSTKNTLEKTLGISASASGKYYGASGNASYNMSQTLKLSEDKIYVVGNHFVIVASNVLTNSASSIDTELPSPEPITEAFSTDLNAKIPNVGLKQSALDLLNRDPSSFLETCGDSYVTSVLFGGVQSVGLVLDIKTRDEFNSVSGSIGGGFDGGVVGGSASLTVNSTIRKYSEKKKLSILESRTGADRTASAITLEELEQRFKSFPTEVATYLAGDKTPIFVSLRRYDMLSNWPEGKIFPSEWGNSVFLAQEEAALDDLIHITRDVIDSSNVQILDERVSEETLRKSESTIQSELNLIRNRRAACSAEPGKCDITNLWKDDLDARLLLPVRKDEVPAWKTLNTTERRLAAAKAKPCPFNPEACKKEIRILTSRLGPQREALRIDAINARIAKWLKRTNDIRCDGAQQARWGCVNSGIIEAYRAKLLEPPAPAPASAMEPAMAGEPEVTFLTVSELPTVTVNCVCDTKNNPSWCALPLGNFDQISYTRVSRQTPNDPWTPEFTAIYCQRHHEETCLCDDLKYFHGSVDQ
ncbi:hypothetical protein NKI79_12330 [Mesorhizobium sp. M0340]|uniref:hypothetical protein n=1 Tax=Mesorhizobium sp. M0340 TaxID=2956939 RepID=UPI003339C59C